MTDADTDREPGRVRPFADILQDLAHGDVHDDASVRMCELVTAVQAHQKKGTLTLTIEVAPLPKGDASTVIVSARVDSKPPKGGIAPSVFYIDDGGNLTRHDPRQMHLPLREVPTPTPEEKIRSAYA